MLRKLSLKVSQTIKTNFYGQLFRSSAATGPAMCNEELPIGPKYEWLDPKNQDEIVNIVYVDKNGTRFPIKGKVGDNVMYLARRYDIEIEGACEGVLGCSTCHVYVDFNYLDKIPPISEKEDDMLGNAFYLQENSRLSCQIKLTKQLEGIEIKLPFATRNFYVDGHVPKHH